MNKTDFDTFSKAVIEPYIEELLKVDTDNNYHCLKYNKNRLKNIFIHYERRRRKIRRYFMHLESKPMDRHKIASVMMYSILRSKVIKVNRLVARLPHKLLMANEYLACYTAISIIESYRKDEIEELTNTESNFNNYKLELPAPYHSPSESEQNLTPYIDNLCKALYYLHSARNFDVFAYSNVLFLLEKYTDALCNTDME